MTTTTRRHRCETGSRWRSCRCMRHIGVRRGGVVVDVGDVERGVLAVELAVVDLARAGQGPYLTSLDGHSQNVSWRPFGVAAGSLALTSKRP